jgi:hypothetical protein
MPRTASKGKEQGEMRRLAFAAVVLVAVLFIAQSAAATSFMLNGSGSLMKNGATYSGTFLSGMTGTWTIDLDDSLWPADSDSTARFNYIWQTFFAGHYDGTVGAQGWWGFFNGATLPTTPQFAFNTTSPGGIIAGDITITILIRDGYSDGILSQSEKHRNSQLSGTLNVNPALGTGTFVNLCGDGSLSSGNFNFHNLPKLDTIQLVGQITTYVCPSPVENTTWGTVKALYR